MKKNYFYFVLLLIFAAMGCKEKVVPPTASKDYRYLHVVNFYHSIPAVSMNVTALGQAQLDIASLKLFATYPPNNYAKMESSAEKYYYMVQNPLNDAYLIAQDSMNLRLKGSYTMIFTDIAGTFKRLFIEDKFDSLATNTSGVRFLHLSEQTGALLVYVKSLDTQIQFSPLSYLNYTNFKQCPSGKYTFAAINAADQKIITQTATVELKENKYYNFYLVDDGTTKVLKVEQVVKY